MRNIKFGAAKACPGKRGKSARLVNWFSSHSSEGLSLNMSMSLSLLLSVGVIISGAANTAFSQNTPEVIDRAPSARQNTTPKKPAIRSVVSLVVKDSSIAYVLDELARQAKVRVVYNNTNPALKKRIVANITKFDVMDAFAEVLKGTGMAAGFAPDGETVVIRSEQNQGRQDSTASKESFGSLNVIVIDATSKSAVFGAEIRVSDNSKGVTGLDGESLLVRVPVGQRILSIRALGYRGETRKVTVSPNELTRITVELSFLPRSLSEVVTTGAGDRQRLEVGTSSSIINADSIVKTTPIRDISDLIKSRAPGTQVISSGGTVGSGSRIRIRGIGGIITNSDPIVILDGIRMDAAYSVRPGETQREEGNTSMSSNQLRTNAPATSRINDIDPEMIESIEILKGPSASTLYGSDAANGVIVIRTKRGRAGAARWNFATSQGTSSMKAKFPDSWMAWGSSPLWAQPGICTLVESSEGICTIDSVTSYNPLNHKESTPFGSGYNGSYSMSVSGGTTGIQYYLGATHNRATGLLKMPETEVKRWKNVKGDVPLSDWAKRPNVLNNTNITFNLSSEINSKADVRLTGMVGTQYHRDAARGGSSFVNVALSSPGYRDSIGAGWGPDGPLFAFLERISDATKRYTGGFQSNYRPNEKFNFSSVLGWDQGIRTDESLLRQEDVVGFVAVIPLVSQKGRYEGNTTNRNVSLNGVFNLPLPSGMSSRTTFGLQYQRVDANGIAIEVENLAPGRDALDGGIIKPGSPRETRNSSATMGWILDQTVNLRGNLFVTGAMRADIGSSFGKEAKPMLYPKFNASWLVSEESFFPKNNVITGFRLRSAFGQAGVQPGTTARFRSYSTLNTTNAGTSVVSFNITSLGNVGLVPERSVEIEGGFDLSMWEDRAAIDLTGYRKVAKNALIFRSLPQSFGVVSRQENLGQVLNTGLEISATGRPIVSDRLTTTVNVGYSKNSNKLQKLNSSMQNLQLVSLRYVEGYPVNGYWGNPIVAYNDINGDGILTPNEIQFGDSAIYLGQSTPDGEFSFHTQLSMFAGRIQLSTGFNLQNGMTQFNTLLRDQCTNNKCPQKLVPGTSFGNQIIGLAINSESNTAHERISWLRWNDLSLTFTGSQTVNRLLKASSTSVVLMGRNLGLWSKYSGADPEINTSDVGNLSMDAGGVPQPRDWSIRFNINF